MSLENVAEKSSDQTKGVDEAPMEPDFAGFGKDGCKKANCRNTIEEWDPHDSCFGHRTCISKSSLSLRPNQYAVCNEASPDCIEKLVKLLTECRRINGRSDNLDVFTPLPCRNFATPFLDT